MQPKRGLSQKGLLAHFTHVPNIVLVVFPQMLVQIGLVLEMLRAELAFKLQAEIAVDRQVAGKRALAAENLLADWAQMLLLVVGKHVAL